MKILLLIVLGLLSVCLSKAGNNDNYYPYQKGFPVETIGHNEAYMSVYELYDNNLRHICKEIVSLYTDYYNLICEQVIYDCYGNLVAKPDDILSLQYSYIDFNFDGLIEIIGSYCTKPGNDQVCYGAMVKRLDGFKLNGFPNPPKTAFAIPAVDDIDRDGNYDIAWGTCETNAFEDNINGAFILGSWGGVFPGFPVIFEPTIPGSPEVNYAFGASPIADVDNDGYMEFLVTIYGQGDFLLRMDGSYYRGWPKSIIWSRGMPVFADIDNDNKVEIIYVDGNCYETVFAFEEDGSFAKHYPLPRYGAWGKSPSVVDIGYDGQLEIFTFSHGEGGSKIYGFRANNGELLPNFPIKIAPVDGREVFPFPSPTVADIDADGEMEILGAGGNAKLCPDGVVIAYNLDGTAVEGFPIIEWHWEFDAGLALDDLDNDGDIEICVATSASCWDHQPDYLYCYDLPYAYDSKKVQWLTNTNSYLHTNRYFDTRTDSPVVRSVEPNSGSYKGGTRVIIKGNNFRAGAKVFFGGVKAEGVEVIDSETIYAIVPAHKPCIGYINDLSVSPYELSYKMIGQAVKAGEQELGGSKSIDMFNLSGIVGSAGDANGCIVNVVVTHPDPDQREGILRAGFTYTGYDRIRDDITLFVSKHVGKGTFENGLGWWEVGDEDFSDPGISWHVVEDGKSSCIQRYGSNNKFVWFGQEDTCMYDREYIERNEGWIRTSTLYVEDEDAAVSFYYYRDVELNYMVMRAITEVQVMLLEFGNPHPKWEVIWHRDSRHASEKQWVWSGWLSLSKYFGKYIMMRFYFDNVVGIMTNHVGWAIDDVQFRGVNWCHDTSEIILEWQGGLPKYFVYRSEAPNYNENIPELRGYTSLTRYVENSYNDDKNYYYKVR